MEDVVVNISDQTRPLTQKGFGLTLILGDSKNAKVKSTYKEYADLTEVSKDYETTNGEYRAAQALFSQEPRPEKVAIYNVQRAEVPTQKELVDALNSIKSLHNDWYYLVITSNKVEDIVAVSEWVTANEKLFGICIGSEDDTASPNIITNLVKQLASDRSFIYAHKHPDVYLNSAIIGKMSPKEPGKATWKFKTLNGIPDSGYTTDELATLDGANINTYIKKFGILQTTEGKTTSGSYIDITQVKDWLKARMQEAVMFVLINNEKVPYTDDGITLIGDAIKAVLKEAFENDAIASDEKGLPMFSVKVPKRKDINVNNRANRILPDIKWDATIAGAVHKVHIDGVVRV